MRIFYAVPRSAWVDLNLRRSLEDMGHELVRFEFPGWPDDADPVWTRSGKPRTNARLLERFRAALEERGGIDLFFGYFYSSVAYPETIEQIRRSGVPTVNFSCNNVHQFDLVRDIAARFDVCIVPEQAAQQDFVRVGARPLRIQLAANPRVYHPYPEPRVYDVTFVGQRYADRAELLQYVREQGIDARAWGAGWQPQKRLNVAQAKAALALVEDERWDGLRRLLRARLGSLPAYRHVGDSEASRRRAMESVPDKRHVTVVEAPRDAAPEPLLSQASRAALTAVDSAAWGAPRLLVRDLVRMFSMSRLSLGFATAGSSHLSDRPLKHLRLREFEAPMSGALYLTEDQPELAEYFRPGQEILTYTDRDDLVETCRWALGHPESAERIRRAGWLRARRDHTWQRRFDELFAALGLPTSR